MTATNTGAFSIGEVFSQSGQILKRNLVKFFLLMVFFEIVTTFVNALLGIPLVPTDAGDLAAFNWIAALIATLIGIAVYSALFCSMTYATYKDLNGESVGFGDMIATPFNRALPLAGLYIIMTIILAVGFALLIVPGVWLLCRYYLSGSALVAEKLGVFASMSRSVELSSGYRWQILAILVLQFVIAFVIGLGLNFIAFSLVGAIGVYGFLVVSIVIYAVIYPYMTILAVVTYHNIRIAKEGVTAAQIVGIFD